MQQYDLPLFELIDYKPELTRNNDFDEFWNETKSELSKTPVEYTMDKYPYPVNGVSVYKLKYKSFNNAQIDCWLALPNSDVAVPGIVLYHGYNWAQEGNIHQTVNLALHGYAVLQMLVRGQQGDSFDNTITSHGHVVGHMTKGILNKTQYYYRAVYMDAIRALDVLSSINQVDSGRIGVMGGSQGGALSLAACALSDIPCIAIADMPYLSHFRRAIDYAIDHPYLEINEYFKRNSSHETEETAMNTLTYFDIMNHAPNIKCNVLINQGLVDTITPPSTVYAVYNHIVSAKRIVPWRYFGHEEIPGSTIDKLTTLGKHLKTFNPTWTD